MTTYYIACDLGAESGRVIEGTLNNEKLLLSDLHRFPNQPVKDKDSLCWDIPQLFQEILIGLRKVAEREDPVASVSCDSWGVDYMLFGQIDSGAPTAAQTPSANRPVGHRARALAPGHRPANQSGGRPGHRLLFARHRRRRGGSARRRSKLGFLEFRHVVVDGGRTSRTDH